MAEVGDHRIDVGGGHGAARHHRGPHPPDHGEQRRGEVNKVEVSSRGELVAKLFAEHDEPAHGHGIART